MAKKKVLALLLVLVMVFGIISTASATTWYVCRYCGEESALYTGESGEDEWGGDLIYYWQYKPYSGSGPHYMREVYQMWHYYECMSCGVEYRLKVTHYGPWVIDTDWVD